MITRRAWAAAQIFAHEIGLPPGGICPASEAAWRVKLTVRAYEEAAETQWRQALVQAVISGGSPEGFDAVSRSFRKYRETAIPWMEGLREKEEMELRRRYAEISKKAFSITPLEKEKPRRFPQ